MWKHFVLLHESTLIISEYKRTLSISEPRNSLVDYPLQVAHARLNKAGHRPLGRTQSAPLPLGHPMLAGGTGAPLVIYENETGPTSVSSSQHSLLKQVSLNYLL